MSKFTRQIYFNVLATKGVSPDFILFGHNIFFEGEVLKTLNRFYKRREMQKLASDNGLDGEEFTYSAQSWKWMSEGRKRLKYNLSLFSVCT